MLQIRRICLFKLVNNSQSYHKRLTQSRHRELVEQRQHFKMFYVLYSIATRLLTARIVIFIL